jgi:23S rRNA pseudouridine1911/1915/1917 synthase
VQEEDEIEIHYPPEKVPDLTPENIPLNILYEDRDLLVINKPAGLVVHPAAGNWSGTLVNGLLHHCALLEGGDPMRPGIVHRLDKDTTGLMVVAKHRAAHQSLVEQFQERKVEKVYYAICSGNPGAGRVDAPIGRSPKDRKKMAIVQGGKESLTLYETMQKGTKTSLVKIFLMTGRTHQIRVHMQHIGFPIVGDPVYGTGGGRQLLHAGKLSFFHPSSGEFLTFEAPMPDDMVLI